jgi:hypothetical protein
MILYRAQKRVEIATLLKRFRSEPRNPIESRAVPLGRVGVLNTEGSGEKRQCSGFVAPRFPAFARGPTAIEFNLRQRRKILLDHFEETLRLGRVLVARRYDERIPLFAGSRTVDFAFNADQQDFMLLTAPIAEPNFVFASRVRRFVCKATPAQHIDRNGEMLQRRPHETDTNLPRTRNDPSCARRSRRRCERRG